MTNISILLTKLALVMDIIQRSRNNVWEFAMSMDTALPFPTSHHKTLTRTGWARLFLVGLCIISLLCCVILKSWGVLLLLGMGVLFVLLPLLLQMEKQMFWAWLVLFPLLYFDPLRLSALVLGHRSFLVVPLFLLTALPGAFISLFTQWKAHRQLMVFTLPLWFLFVGLAVNIFRVKGLFHPEDWARDTIGVAVTIYLLAIGWRLIRQNPVVTHRSLLRTLLIIGMMNALAIIGQHFLHTGLVNAGGFERPMGLFGFPIMAAFISNISLVLMLYRFFLATRKSRQIIFGLGIVIVLMGCFMSLTKSSIVQLAPILGAWALFLPNHLRLKALQMVLLVGFGFVCWEILWDHGGLLTQLTKRFATSDTLSIRESAWSIVGSNLDFPTMLWGRGWLSSTELLGIHNYNYTLFPVDLAIKGGSTAIHPHNAYLKYTYELGIFGIAMLGSYVFLMLKGFYGAFRNPIFHQRLANLAVACTIMILLMASMTGSPMAENYTLFYLSVVLLFLIVQAGWIQKHSNQLGNEAEEPAV